MANKRKANRLKTIAENLNAEKNSPHRKYLKFSFEYCFNHGYGLDELDEKCKLALIQKIIVLSQLSLAQIISSDRRRNGFEKIPITSFNTTPSIPNEFKDEDSVYVYRLPSKKGRLIGYQKDDLFYVVWIDTTLKMYNH